MPKSKHRKKPKAVPVRRRKIELFRVPNHSALDSGWCSGPVPLDRLEKAEAMARAFAADDPEPLLCGENPPTDARIIRCLKLVKEKSFADSQSGTSMRNPDLGQHLWNSGFADKAIVLTGCDFQLAAEAPGQTTDVSFMLTHGDDGQRYCGTLNTQQPAKAVARLVASRQPMVIEGRLSPDTVTGQGGETYRMILGTVKPLGLSSEECADAEEV